jgi:hypothetical protein
MTPSCIHASGLYVLIGHESALFIVPQVVPCLFDMSPLFSPLPCLAVNACLIVLRIYGSSLCSVWGRLGICTASLVLFKR